MAAAPSSLWLAQGQGIQELPSKEEYKLVLFHSKRSSWEAGCTRMIDINECNKTVTDEYQHDVEVTKSGIRSKALNGQTSGGPEEGTEGTGEVRIRDQPESLRKPQQDQEEPGRGMQQRWEAQWQQFLQTLQSPQQSEAAPWDDAKAFLASFEQVAVACQWPRGEWVARLLPALSGEAQQAFSLLAARDKGDYGKVKAAILRGEALRREKQRQHFRQFCCPELEDPRRMYSQVQELCCQWLKPERHTKEQILELLVLEQFLASLPADIQRWVWAGGPDSCAQAVALLEDFLMNWREAESGMWQNVSKKLYGGHKVQSTKYICWDLPADVFSPYTVSILLGIAVLVDSGG
ncbi:uncharacterized protein [Tiliqua scincoides]|uniref:uncharacterized protein n=1 Tax=Tiliqua scincoides TaxID=71010 RepID=UPI00346254B2